MLPDALVLYLPFFRCGSFTYWVLVSWFNFYLCINVILKRLWILDLWVAFPLQNILCSLFIEIELIQSLRLLYLLFALVSTLSGQFEPAKWIFNVKSFINVMFRCLIIDHLWMPKHRLNGVNSLAKQTLPECNGFFTNYMWIKFYMNLILMICPPIHSDFNSFRLFRFIIIIFLRRRSSPESRNYNRYDRTIIILFSSWNKLC